MRFGAVPQFHVEDLMRLSHAGLVTQQLQRPERTLRSVLFNELKATPNDRVAVADETAVLHTEHCAGSEGALGANAGVHATHWGFVRLLLGLRQVGDVSEVRQAVNHFFHIPEHVSE
jgi:hypothetical protein